MTTREQALIAAERELGLRGKLSDFVDMSWPIVEPGVVYQRNWHIDAVCEHLEALARNEISDLLINIPPGFMKSLLCCVFFEPWCWVRIDPGMRFITTSYDGTLALRDAGKAQAILESEWFQDRWGDLFTFQLNQATGDYKNSAEGFRYSTGIGGRITGRHCHVFGVDDPHKPLDISDVSLDTVEKFWHGTVPTRFVDQKTRRRFVVMQRLHCRDLSAIAENEGFTVLKLPMRFEKATCCYTRIGGDMRTEEGQLLWPDRIPEDAVAALEKALQGVGGNRNVAAQLQQRPVPDGGSVFHREWFRYWTKDGGQRLGKETRALPAGMDVLIQSWDCAFKDTDGSDFVCGQVWGRKGPDFYLLAQAWDHMGFAATCDAVRAVMVRWPKAFGKLIEDKANGTAVIETLSKKVPGVIAITPDGGKVARANAITPAFEAGNIYFPWPEGEYTWVTELEDELLSFPVGLHDDRVDALTQAINYLFQRKSNFKEAMQRAKALQKSGLNILAKAMQP